MTAPPPLVERDAALETLRDCLREAERRGHVALVAGEAGIGKTSVLRAMADEHAGRGPVWWGACDALETPHPLAPLLDIARERRTRFAAALGGPRPALFEAVLDELRHAAAPALVVIEDAHWADDATLDLLKFLGRRIDRARAVLAISYRDDEVGLSHPLRRVLGELPPAQRTLIEVPRLSPAGVAALAQRYGGRADGVYEATRGNAFFATEVLRDTTVPRAAVPRSVRDVVLARFARLPAPVQALLQVVAVVPGRTERWLVDALLAPPLADVEAALASGLLVAEEAHLGYRHELGRVAIERSLSAPLALDLHRRVLAALAEPGRDAAPARLVHHAVASNDRAAITRHAPAAAREATARAAYREAGAQWRIALRLGAAADTAERLDWLEAFATTALINGWAEEALAALQEAEALARSAGDTRRAAVARARQSSPLAGMLRHAEATAAIHEGMAMVGTLAPGPEHALIWCLEAHLRMLDRDYADSILWGDRARALAEALGDEALRDRADLATGAALLFVDYPAGVARLLALRDRRAAAGAPLGVSSAYGMVGSGAGELMHLAQAEGWLRESVRIAEEHDFNGRYSEAWLALCLMLRGAWDEAAAVASGVVAREPGTNIARMMALLALARLRLRRGDPGVDEVLAEARAMAYGSGALQRIAPTACAHAEAAFLRGDHAGVRAAVELALPLALSKGHPWFVGELNYWRWRVDPREAPAGDCAEPYALEMAGEWAAAARAWDALGCPFEHARALALGDTPAQQQALAVFDRLGARPAAEALRRRLREAGVRDVPRGARASTRGNPAGLTATELQVLALMCQDLRNAQIAARLHRSVRTIDHHVAAVLGKLGVASRVEAVRRAEREGWVVRDAPVPSKDRQSRSAE
jgi:DNA-binding CsgD family transcriptional regulator